MEENAQKGVELIKTLRTPEFAEFFNKEMEPVLQKVETLRNKFVSVYYSSIVLSAVIAVGIYCLTKSFAGVFVALFIIIIVKKYIKCVYSLTAKSQVMGKLLSFWGDFSCETPNVKDLMWKWLAELAFDYTDTGIYEARETKQSYYDNNDYIASPHGRYVKSLRLLPSFNRCYAFEVLDGVYKNLSLTIRALRLEYISFTKNYITIGPVKIGRRTVNRIFNGIFVTCNLNKKFDGHIVIKKKKSWLDKFEGLNFPEHITIDDPIFEDVFEIYADDIFEAKRLLTIPVMQRLIFIAKQKGKFDILCSFENGVMNLALQKRGKWFDVSMFRSANTIKHYQKMLMDLGKILTIIDTLKAEEKTVTDGRKH